MKRRDFFQVATPAFLLLANGQFAKTTQLFLDEEHKKKVRYRFVVASDGHYGQPETAYEEYFARLVTRINEEHARHPFRFCVINGDIIHDDKTHFPAAKAALDKLHPNYYVSQGNHDHVNAGDWEKIWNMPVNLDFTIEKDAYLVVTTSNEQGTYLCPDINWLQQKLEQYRLQENTFIFMHINPGKLTKYGIDCAPLFDIFARYKNIRMIFNGHDHDEEGIRVKNEIPFVFDAHFGGNWGTSYRGFRVVERMKDNSVFTYLLDPVKRLNETTLANLAAQ